MAIPAWAQQMGATDQGLQNYRRRRAGGAALGEDPITLNGQPVAQTPDQGQNQGGGTAQAAENLMNDITQRRVNRSRPGNRGGQTARNRAARRGGGGNSLGVDPTPAAPGAGRTSPALQVDPSMAGTGLANRAARTGTGSGIQTSGFDPAAAAREAAAKLGMQPTPFQSQPGSASRSAGSAFSRGDRANREAQRQARIASRGQAPPGGVGSPVPAPTPTITPTPTPTTTGAPPPGPTLSNAPAPFISPDMNPGANPQRGRPTPGTSYPPSEGDGYPGGPEGGYNPMPQGGGGGSQADMNPRFGGQADMNPRPWSGGGGGAAGGASDGGWADGGGPTRGGGTFGGSEGGGQAADGLPVMGGPQVSQMDPMQPNQDEMRKLLLQKRGGGVQTPPINPRPVY